MSYKIAVATATGEKIDVHFGQAEYFYVYSVNDKKIELIERRNFNGDDVASSGNSGCCAFASRKIELIEDCRGIAAAKVGLKVQKELSKRNISIFDDLDCSVKSALEAISEYFYKIDNHINIGGSI